MKLSLRTLLLALPLVAATALAGCAAEPAGEATGDASNAVSATGPITLANYVTHPTLEPIRRALADVDPAALAESVNPGCDGTNTKRTAADGTIRYVKSTGGEGGFEGLTEVWYSEAGKPFFGFHKEIDLTGEKTDNGDPFVSEWRTYFDAAGEPIFQVIREGQVRHASTPLPRSLDRLPEAHEKITAESYADPSAWYASTGCGETGKP